MSTPITRAAHGSTRCVSCGKKFETTPNRAITVLECEEFGWGMSPSGHTYRRLTSIRVGRRWHTEVAS